MAAAPQAKSDTAARARRDRRRQRMMPGNGADRSVGRGWVTQYPSASKRPPRAKVQPYPPDANVTVLFPPHDGARPRAADLLANWLGAKGGPPFGAVGRDCLEQTDIRGGDADHPPPPSQRH